jgi:hypothetical protein
MGFAIGASKNKICGATGKFDFGSNRPKTVLQTDLSVALIDKSVVTTDFSFKAIDKSVRRTVLRCLEDQII